MGGTYDNNVNKVIQDLNEMQVSVAPTNECYDFVHLQSRDKQQWNTMFVTYSYKGQ